MHHLLVTLGSHGDTHPFIGIGAALRARGHRVTLIANELYEPLARAAGLKFFQIGTAVDFRNTLDSPDIWHPVKGFKTIFEMGLLPMMRPAFEAIRQLHVPGETVVTAHAIAFGARIAQEVLGVPLVTIHLSPVVIRSKYDPPLYPGGEFLRWMPRAVIPALYRLADWRVIDPVVAGPVNAFRAEFGLPKVKRLLDDWWESPQRVIGLFPEWFAPPQRDWPDRLKLTGFPLYDERGVQALPPELSAFLDAGPPPVAFTFGSAMTLARVQLEASAEACRISGRRGLLLTLHRDQVPESLPPNVRHFDYAPFSELLPRCAALVHHGGIGTTAQALAAGVPQLVMPLAHDQHDNAARVRRLEVGRSLTLKSYRAKKVASALDRLLGDAELRDRCTSIARRFKDTHPIEKTCDLIEAV